MDNELDFECDIDIHFSLLQVVRPVHDERLEPVFLGAAGPELLAEWVIIVHQACLLGGGGDLVELGKQAIEFWNILRDNFRPRIEA